MSENIYEEVWHYAMNELHEEYKKNDKESEFIFNFNMNYIEDTIDKITVSVASVFMKQIMTNKGSFEIVQNKIRELTGQNNIQIECIIKKDSKPAETNEPSNEPIQTENHEEKVIEKKPLKKHPQLEEEYNFETFIPGDNCKFAYNAALAVAKEPGTTKNPVLFYGGSGLGKTHLMKAMGNYIYANNPKWKICYISAEAFTNEFLDSLRTKKTNEFKNKYRNLDVLLLDDIHFLQGKEQTQEELFYTFNALKDSKAQMVFTCDRPIKEIKNMADRLVSRLSNGLTIDISAPKYEDRYAILQKKCELMGQNLDPEIIDYIARNIETNVRDLEGALNTLINYSELVDQNLSLELAKSQLKNIISNSIENISLDVIEKVVADNYQISVSELKGKKKDKKYVIPRQIAIYISREITEISYMELGNEFGKDHSTIMHAYEKISDQIKIDPTLDSKIKLYINEIKEYKKS